MVRHRSERTVRFDERTWGRLATMADDQRITIAELIESAARRLVTGTTTADTVKSRTLHREALTNRFIRMRRAGATITQIADDTGYSTTYISRILIDAGLRSYRTRSDAGKAAA
jgi:transposase